MKLFFGGIPPDLPDGLYPVVVNTSIPMEISPKSSKHFELQFTMDNCISGERYPLHFYEFKFSEFVLGLNVETIVFSSYQVCTLPVQLINNSDYPIIIAANSIVGLVTTTKPVLDEDILRCLNKLSTVILCDLCSFIYVSYL